MTQNYSWTEVGEDPGCEVLARSKYGEFLVGYLENIQGVWECTDDHQLLDAVTHYIKIKDLWIG